MQEALTDSKRKDRSLEWGETNRVSMGLYYEIWYRWYNWDIQKLD